MKLIGLALFLVVISQDLRADDLSNNRPRKDQLSVLLTAITSLQATHSPLFESSFLNRSGTSYYLRDASFLGRTQTAKGFKNLIRVTFVRSILYAKEGEPRPPSTIHSFVVIFHDDLNPECFLSIPMPDSAVLEDSVLKVDKTQYALANEVAFKAFTPISSEQPAPSGGDKPSN